MFNIDYNNIVDKLSTYLHVDNCFYEFASNSSEENFYDDCKRQRSIQNFHDRGFSSLFVVGETRALFRSPTRFSPVCLDQLVLFIIE